MKIKFLSLLLLASAVTFNCMKTQAQVTVGAGCDPLPVAVLEVMSDYQNGVLGGFRLPQLTGSEVEILKVQILSLPDEDKDRARGLVIFNTTTSCTTVWSGTEFKSLCGDIGPASLEVHCESIVVSPANSDIPIETTYRQGSPLNPLANYIEVPVTVKTRGTYIITATTGNGYAFETSGNLLEVGDHLLTLRGQGTPFNPTTSTLADTLRFQVNGQPVTGVGIECSPVITVKEATIFATYSECPSILPNGKYIKGTPLNNSHTITLQVNFNHAANLGSASFEVKGGGMTFTGGGTYLPGLHTVVLTGSGIPDAIGTQSLTLTAYNGAAPANACSSTVKVISRVIKVMGLGYGIYQPGTASAKESAKAILSSTKNFGSAADSTYPVDGITIVDAGNTTGQSLANKIASEKPDIIVMGYAYSMYHMGSDATVNALANFANSKKNVLITFTEHGTDDVTKLIKLICGTDGNPKVEGNGSDGKTYQFVDGTTADTQHPILAGPFANLYNKYWGEDGSATGRLTAVPANTKVLSYDYQNNHTNQPTAIVHNDKGFIWAGDGGVLAGDQNNDSKSTFPCRNSNGLPVTKVYSPHNVENSFFYANAIAWAIDYVNTTHP